MLHLGSSAVLEAFPGAVEGDLSVLGVSAMLITELS